MKSGLLFSLFLIVCSGLSAQVGEDLQVDYMLRGHFFAQSSIEDQKAFGGFAGSDNAARVIDSRLEALGEGIFLHIDDSKLIPVGGKYQGYKVYLVNHSPEVAAFEASDSRLSIIAEAFISGGWRPIEYLPSSWCGNSYHTVSLAGSQYWEFEVLRFAGTMSTQIRYHLFRKNAADIYSNAIEASINPRQLHEKQGHTPAGWMDPYRD